MGPALAYCSSEWPCGAGEGVAGMQWIVFWVLVAIIVTTGFGAMGPM